MAKALLTILIADSRRDPGSRWPLHTTQTATGHGQQSLDLEAAKGLPADIRRAAHPRLVPHASRWRSTARLLGIRS
jgi:hypothetical protein